MKALRLIGLARRAGRLAVGDDAAMAAIRSGRAFMALTAADAAANTRDRAQNAASRYNIPHYIVPQSKIQMGAALGLEQCAICAILDRGLAGAISAELSKL